METDSAIYIRLWVGTRKKRLKRGSARHLVQTLHYDETLMTVVLLTLEFLAKFAPAAAAVFAWQAIRQVRSLWHAERLSEVFRTVARGPIMEARNDFVDEMRRLFQESLATGQGDAMDGALRAAIHRYRAALRQIRSIRVLDLHGFADQLIRAAEDVEDELTMLLAIPDEHATTRQRKLESLLAKHSASVADIVAQNDPALPKARRFRSQPSLPPRGRDAGKRNPALHANRCESSGIGRLARQW